MNIFFKKDNRFNIFAVLILILVIVTRFIAIDTTPSAVNQDELVNMYDGYCIAERGRDHWGASYPFIVRSLGEGDYRPALQAYLCAASIKIFGFSVWAGRLPMVLLNIWAIYLLYLIAIKCFGTEWGLLSALIACFSPWIFLQSHSAHEGAFLPAFFTILILYLFLKSQENYKNINKLMLLGFIIGLSTSAYQTSRIIAILISIAIFIDIVLERKHLKEKKYLPFLIFPISVFVGAIPQIWAFVFQFQEFVARGQYSILEINSIKEFVLQVLINLGNNLSPGILFSEFGDIRELSIARGYEFEKYFFYLGISFLFFARILKPNLNFIIIILLFESVLPASITENTAHTLRISSLMMLIPFLIVYGIYGFIYFLRILITKQRIFNLAKIIVVTGFIFMEIFYCIKSVKEYTGDKTLRSFRIKDRYNFEISMKLNKLKDNYEKIYIADIMDQGYIYIASFCEISPEENLKTIKIFDKTNQFDDFHQYGKYHFVYDNIVPTSQGKEILYITNEKINSTKSSTCIDSVVVMNRYAYFYSLY